MDIARTRIGRVHCNLSRHVPNNGRTKNVVVENGFHEFAEWAYFSVFLTEHHGFGQTWVRVANQTDEAV